MLSFANMIRVMLDAYSRRHEAQKIYLRQGAAQRWIGWRDQVLQGERPHSGHTEQLSACDAQLRVVSTHRSLPTCLGYDNRLGQTFIPPTETRQSYQEPGPCTIKIYMAGLT